jgi:hypothetical protein
MARLKLRELLMPMVVSLVDMEASGSKKVGRDGNYCLIFLSTARMVMTVALANCEE